MLSMHACGSVMLHTTVPRLQVNVVVVGCDSTYACLLACYCLRVGLDQARNTLALRCVALIQSPVLACTVLAEFVLNTTRTQSSALQQSFPRAEAPGDPLRATISFSK